LSQIFIVVAGLFGALGVAFASVAAHGAAIGNREWSR